jgi:uncharacterized protein (TIGR03437 family)
VSVTINGKPASVAYISPTQINVLAPADPNLFLMPRASVTVRNALGTGQFSNAFAQLYSPGWFTFSPQNGRYAAATFSDGSYLGPPGLLGAEVETKPAGPAT